MKKQLVLMVLGVALGCGNDPTSVSSANPDPSSCGKGSISPGDVKTGTLSSASCLRYDHVYLNDSSVFDSYSFKADKGKGYSFRLDRATGADLDPFMELVTVDPNTGDEELLAISDDEGAQGNSQFYFIAPVSGTFYLRAGAYDRADVGGYTLTAKSCDSPIPEITGTLIASTQTLSAADCVLAQPEFVDDSSYVKLFSVHVGPNETKTITVTSTDFPPAFQVFGPAWGVPCDYDYEGCGGGSAGIDKSDTESFTVHVPGNEHCNNFSVHGADHASPSGVQQSPGISLCQYFNFPGQYTIAVGSFWGAVGSFTISVVENETPVRIVGPDAGDRNPTLNFLRKKPLRASEYLNRTH
ncbi:MAG TPA: hypothetical protein VGO46_04630 [Gemmatimonadaceae bacterium]|jgi:hypothetical protein|nr:hypothetical protein [Gemmatimonadaceae bacterium]